MTISEMKSLKTDLESHQLILEEKLAELDRARHVEALERQRLSQSRTSVDRLLRETKGQEATFQKMVQQSQKDLDAIRSQIQFLGLLFNVDFHFLGYPCGLKDATHFRHSSPQLFAGLL